MTSTSSSQNVRTIPGVVNFTQKTVSVYAKHGEPIVKTGHVEFEANSDRIIIVFGSAGSDSYGTKIIRTYHTYSTVLMYVLYTLYVSRANLFIFLSDIFSNWHPFLFHVISQIQIQQQQLDQHTGSAFFNSWSYTIRD